MYTVKEIIMKNEKYNPGSRVVLKHSNTTITSSAAITAGAIIPAQALSKGDWASWIRKLSNSSSLLTAVYTKRRMYR
jgi:hypothetical protein